MSMYVVFIIVRYVCPKADGVSMLLLLPNAYPVVGPPDFSIHFLHCYFIVLRHVHLSMLIHLSTSDLQLLA